MKFSKIVLLLASSLVCIGIGVKSDAQAFNSYGHTPYMIRSYTTIGHYPYTVRLNGYDTLSNADTSWAQIGYPNKYNMIFDLYVTKLSGTLAGTAILKASNKATVPAVGDFTWMPITGTSTYCTSCVSTYSVTIANTTGTAQYEWHVPYDAADYNNWEIEVITSGTCTATYTVLPTYRN